MKSEKQFQISESEEIIMECLQKHGELSLSEISRLVKEQNNWADSTIKTFVRRMCEKGALIAEKREVYYYRPSYSMEERKHYMLQELLSTAFEGSMRNLMMNYLETEAVDERELKEVDQLLMNYRKKKEKKVQEVTDLPR